MELKDKSNVEVIYNSNVTKLIGGDALESIEIMDNDGNTKSIDVSGLFIAIGRIPENANFTKIINVDDTGYIKALEDCKTNVDGIFVAGDARVKTLRQLVTAASDGAISATNAIKYINRRNNV